MKKVVVLLLKFYRKYISPNKLQCCRFYPSCSEYALDAVQKFGFVRGLWKGLCRLLRCHPFSSGGYDPVK